LIIIGITAALVSVATFVIIDTYQSQLEWDKRLTESETKKLWKTTDDWNSLRLTRNDARLYCSSASEESSDHCYSLELIVFEV
jgi:hypothetical protein